MGETGRVERFDDLDMPSRQETGCFIDGLWCGEAADVVPCFMGVGFTHNGLRVATTIRIHLYTQCVQPSHVLAVRRQRIMGPSAGPDAA